MPIATSASVQAATLRAAAFLRRAALPLALLLLVPASAVAGGTKSPEPASSIPLSWASPHWSTGQVNYSVDQGPLSASVTNQQATAMVDAAAALWSAVSPPALR